MEYQQILNLLDNTTNQPYKQIIIYCCITETNK